MNNSFNIAIELSLNEIIYDFKVRKLVFVINFQKISKIIFEQRLKYQRKVVDVTTFVNVKTKMYYNVKHQFILFNFGDKIYLRLYQSYNLFDRFN